jgi:hypothetical protein
MVLAASSLASCSSLKTISSNVQAKAQKITAKKPRPVEINKGNTEVGEIEFLTNIYLILFKLHELSAVKSLINIFSHLFM